MQAECFITATSAFLPNEPIDNDACVQIMDGDLKRPSRVRSMILKSNGIKTRYYALDPVTRQPTHTNAQLAATAIRSLAESAGVTIGSLRGLYCGTSSPDQMIPAHANMVHAELKNPPCETVSFAAVCTSSMAALNYARMKVLCGEIDKAVAVGSENASCALRLEAFVHPPFSEPRKPDASLAFQTEFIRWMLSDGASAVMLEPTPRAGQKCFKIEWVENVSFANELETCMYLGATKNSDGSLVGWKSNAKEREANGTFNLKQDSRLLDKHIIEVVVDGACGRVKEKYNLKPDDIQWYVPHLSSMYFKPRLIEGLERIGLPIPESKWFMNLENVGNIGSASLFSALHELKKQRDLKVGDRILCMVPESAKFSVVHMMLTVC